MEYEAQAQDFLAKHNLRILTAFRGDKCPPWDDDRHIHGDRYRITIKRGKDTAPQDRNIRQPQPSISFDFWNSYSDSRDGKRPTAYDILVSVSSEANSPTDADEVAEEFGEMKPSQAIAIAKFAKRLQEFFTADELNDLAEIQ